MNGQTDKRTDRRTNGNFYGKTEGWMDGCYIFPCSDRDIFTLLIGNFLIDSVSTGMMIDTYNCTTREKDVYGCSKGSTRAI